MEISLLLSIVLFAILVTGLGLWLFGERGHLALDSTKLWFTDQNWKKNGKLTKSIHGYIYMRWQNQYIKYFVIQMGKIAPQPIREYITNRYHAKLLTNEEANAIINIHESIPLKDLEQIVPYPVVRDFMHKAPSEIIVYECGCRNAREEHCVPTQVCMWIGQPYINFILEHNPQSAKRITREAALQLLAEEHSRGHVHAAWFKDAMQERFYCICNCCSCCCAGIESMRKYGIQTMSSSGFLAVIDSTECKMCESCSNICPFHAIEISPDQMNILPVSCMGCGICVDQCPNNAIRLAPAPEKGIPFDVRAFSNVKSP